jgi:hypothetical protein
MHASEHLAVAPKRNASASALAVRGVAAASLAVLIATPVFAQQTLPPPPSSVQAVPPPVLAPSGARQRLVPQHFDQQGRFVPSHYESGKTLRFRGHFAKDAKQREEEKQRGYVLPAPDYGDTTPPPMPEKKIEGRE